MGCQKDRAKRKPKPGRFCCGKCGAISKKKKHLCKPAKIKEDKSGEPKDKKT